MNAVLSIYGPTVAQADRYTALLASPLFTDAERHAAQTWLLTRATQQGMTDRLAFIEAETTKRAARYSADWFGDAPLAPAERERCEQVDAVRSAALGDLMPNEER